MAKLLAVDQSVKSRLQANMKLLPQILWLDNRRGPFDLEPVRIIVQTASVPGCSSNCPDEEQPQSVSHSSHFQSKGFGGRGYGVVSFRVWFALEECTGR
jgi:hypothetical protein